MTERAIGSRSVSGLNKGKTVVVGFDGADKMAIEDCCGCCTCITGECFYGILWNIFGFGWLFALIYKIISLFIYIRYMWMLLSSM